MAISVLPRVSIAAFMKPVPQIGPELPPTCLETIIEIVLGLLDTPVVVVGDDRRIRALSRGAGEQLAGDAVGKALSSVLPDDVFAALDAQLTTVASGSDGDAAAAEPGSTPLDVQRLPGGGAVVVFGAG